MKYETIALPVTPDGRTYVTHEVMAEHPEIAAFIERTRDCWEKSSLEMDILIMKRANPLDKCNASGHDIAG
jgi:hypothetical protein